jgi:HAD superfamily hydrolase (TIGR01509 family)
MPELVIFDCDGVLVDSEPLANRVMYEKLAGAGFHLTLTQCNELLMGRTLSDCVAIIETHTGQALPDGFMVDLENATRVAFDHDLRAVDGVAVVLQSLARPFCVASSGSRGKIDHSLKLTSLDHFFPDERIFSADQVARGKPAPDLFLTAAEQLGVAPQDCVVVEDSIPGVEAGCVAGMTVLGYAARTAPRGLQMAGACVFTSMEQLPDLLGQG